MNRRTFLLIMTATLTLGLENIAIQPKPARAESEAGLEAPVMLGRRYRRWGGGRVRQVPQVRYQQQLAAKNLRANQKDANRRARAISKLKKSDIIRNYSPTK